MNDSEGEDKSRAVFLVKDISCTVCGLVIEKQVRKLDGVKDVRTSIMLNKVFVDYDPSKVKMEEIRRAIDGRGYGTHITLSKR